MQRNGQNPIRSVKNFEHGGKHNDPGASHVHSQGGPVVCPSCKTEVQPKPGFRLSALKCPKCGHSLGKK